MFYFFPIWFYFYEVAIKHGILSYLWMEVSHVGLRGVFEHAVLRDSLVHTVSCCGTLSDRFGAYSSCCGTPTKELISVFSQTFFLLPTTDFKEILSNRIVTI